jgi:hypothetical protein
VRYVNIKTAWMITHEFNKWLLEWNLKLRGYVDIEAVNSVKCATFSNVHDMTCANMIVGLAASLLSSPTTLPLTPSPTTTQRKSMGSTLSP